MENSVLPTIFGALAGFSASVLPHAFELIKESQVHKHTMAQKQLDLQAAKDGYEFELKRTETTASTDELKALLEHDNKLEGSKWIVDLRASVRPVVTYLFVILFVIVKLATLIRFVFYADVSPVTAIELLWDSETVALFSAVLSFWFGSRAMEGYRAYARSRRK